MGVSFLPWLYFIHVKPPTVFVIISRGEYNITRQCIESRVDEEGLMKSRAAAAVVPQHREYTLARKLFRAKGNDLSIKQSEPRTMDSISASTIRPLICRPEQEQKFQ